MLSDGTTRSAWPSPSTSAITGYSRHVPELTTCANMVLPSLPAYTRSQHSSRYTTSSAPSPLKSNVDDPVPPDDTSLVARCQSTPSSVPVQSAGFGLVAHLSAYT